MKIVTADLFDAHHEFADVCNVQFRNYGAKDCFFGSCQTLKVFEDHVPVREALSQEGAGRVLVVDGGGSLRVGIVGDQMSEMAVRNGWQGIVVFAAIRDSVGIDALDLGVRALGATARKAFHRVDGLHGVPLQIQSTRFETGDWIYVDLDSVLVSKRQLDLGGT